MSKLTKSGQRALHWAASKGLVQYLGTFWRPNIPESEIGKAVIDVFTTQTVTALYKRGLVDFPLPGLCAATDAGRILCDHAPDPK